MVKYIIQPKSLAEKLLRLNIKNTIYQLNIVNGINTILITYYIEG